MRIESHITFLTEINVSESLLSDINLKVNKADKLQAVDLFTDTEAYTKLTNALKASGIQYDELFTRIFSKDELLNSQYISFRSTVPWGYVQNEHEIYDPGTICKFCGNGGVQVNPVTLKREPKNEYADILSPTGIKSIFFVRETILENMLPMGFSGHEILPLVHYSKKKIINGWKQILPKNILPRMSSKTNIPLVEEDAELLSEFGLEPISPCKCGNKGRNIPETIIYDKSNLNNFCDFNLSCEWLGGGEGTQPLTIISVAVLKFLLENTRSKHMHFEPVYFQ